MIRQLFDLNTVFEISQTFHSVLDTHALLDGIVLTMIGQMGVGAAAVVIQMPGDTKCLTQSRSKGWIDIKDSDWHVDLRSPFAKVLHNEGCPILVEELLPRIEADPHFAEFLPRIGCALVAPFAGRDRLRGVLFAAPKLNGHPFTRDDLQFLGMITQQISIAVDNAVLYESERRAARELIATRERLVRNERLATLGRLSAAIAHEVNNPLGIIRNYLQVMRDDLHDRPNTLETLNMVADEVDRIARIVRQLLDAFRPDTSRPAAIDIGEVLEGVLTFLRAELKRDAVVIESSGLDNLPFVIGRDDPLRQVFINLALNARDAMVNGGTLTITADADDQFVTVSVRDEGCGIASEALEQLFDPFFSTKEHGRGTGLGLSICRSILEGFGGRIEAENVNDPRTGAIFRVFLPRVDASDDTIDTAHESQQGSVS
ncbi:MAG: hypothetical protein Kow0074_19320 [Candidatus Zixiibacteriota bacterium]